MICNDGDGLLFQKRLDHFSGERIVTWFLLCKMVSFQWILFCIVYKPRTFEAKPVFPFFSRGYLDCGSMVTNVHTLDIFYCCIGKEEEFFAY